MSIYQNSGSQSAGRRGPRRGRREGVPARSAAWTAVATSCAVSASMTMFRRSSTRRTTCPACGGASCGPVLAGEGPAGSGSVTPGTVEETVLARLIDTPALQRPLRRRPGRRPPGLAPVVDHVENRSIYNTRSSPGDQPRSLAACFLRLSGMPTASWGQHGCRAGTTEGAAAPRRGCRARSWCGSGRRPAPAAGRPGSARAAGWPGPGPPAPGRSKRRALS
jgi:hypothetical protein